MAAAATIYLIFFTPEEVDELALSKATQEPLDATDLSGSSGEMFRV